MDAGRLFNAYTSFGELFPALKPFVTTFLTCLLRSHRVKLQHRFLRKCMEEQVIPKSLTNRRLDNLATVLFEKYHRLILKKHIELAKIEENAVFQELRRHKAILLNVIPEYYRNVIFDYCYNRLRLHCNKIRNKHVNKINRLIRESKWTTDANNDFVCNISNKPLDNNTLTALGYGINFSVKEGIDWVEIANGFCKLERNGNTPVEQISLCKGIVYGMSINNINPSVPLRFLEAYKKIKKDRELHITKADKSNTLVIMIKRGL